MSGKAQNIIELGFNIEELTAEKQVVLGLFQDMFAQIAKYDGAKFNPLGGGGLTEFKRSVTDTNEAMNGLQQTATKYNQVVTEQFQRQKELSGAYLNTGAAIEKSSEKIAKYKLILEELKNEQKRYKEQLEAGTLELDAYTSKMGKSIAVQEQYKKQISDLNKELKSNISLDFAAPNTRAEARSQNVVLNNLAENTNVADTGKLAEINALIDRNNKLIDENSDLLAKQKINIGNYPTAFKGAFSVVEKEMKSLADTLNSTSFDGKNIDNLVKKQETLKNVTMLLGQEFKTTAAQQNAYKEAAKQIGQVFGTDSDVFKNFNKEVGVGTKELKNINKEVDAAASGSSKLGNAASKAFGGLRTLANIIPGLGISGVILALLTPITALGEALFKTNYVAKKTTDEFKDLGDVMLKNSDIVAGSKQKYEDATENVEKLTEYIQLAKEGFLDKDKVVKVYNETIGKTTGEVKNLEEAEKELNKNAEAYIKFTLLKASANVAAQKAAEQAFQAEEIRQKKNQQFAETPDGFFGSLGTRTEKELQEEGKRQIKLRDARKKSQVQEKVDQQKTFEDIFKSLTDQAAKLAKASGFDFFGDDDKTGKGRKGGADRLKAITSKFYAEDLKDQSAYLKERSKLEIFSIEERERLRQKAYAIDQEIADKERATELSNEKTKLQTALSQKGLGKNEKINAQNEYNKALEELDLKYATTSRRLYEGLNSDLLKLNEDYNQKRLTALNSVDKNELEADSARQEAITKDIQQELDARLDALKKNIEDKTQIIFNDYQLSLTRAKNEDEIKVLQSNRDKQLVAITATTQKEIYDIVISFGDRRLKAIQEQNKTEAEANKVSADYNAQSDDLNQALIKGKISYGKYLNEKASLDRKYLIDKDNAAISADEASLQRLRDYMKEELDIKIGAAQDALTAVKDSGDEDEVGKAKSKLDALLEDRRKAAVEERSIAEKLNKDKQKLTEDTVDPIRKAHDRIRQNEAQIAQESFNLAKTLVSSSAENRINQIQEQIDKENEQAETTINNIERSTLSERDKLQTTIILQNQQKAREKALKDEQKKEKIQSAQFDQKLALAQIAWHTAEAVMKDVKGVPWPLSLAVAATDIALGAVQAAIVLATPIPAYKDGIGIPGKGEHPGGWALTGEAGPELVKEKGKAPYIVTEPTLINLSAKASVLPLGNLVMDLGNIAMANGMAMINNHSQGNDAWAIAQWQTEQNRRMYSKTNRAIKNSVKIYLGEELSEFYIRTKITGN